MEDLYSGDPFLLYYFTGKDPTLEVEPDKWIVESIDGHRKDPSRGPEFLVKWKDGTLPTAVGKLDLAFSQASMRSL